MTSYESWGDLYIRLYPTKHLSELTLMNNIEVRSQYVEDTVISIDLLEDEEGMQIHHLRFLLRLFFGL